MVELISDKLIRLNSETSSMVWSMIWPSRIQEICSRPDSELKYLARMYWRYSGTLFFRRTF